MNAVLLAYQARIVTLHASAAQLRMGQMMAVIMMSIALVAILLIAVFSLARRNVPLFDSFLPLPFAIGKEFARSGHCYDKDLHLFGEGSLFELLCTCRTEVGRRHLANYLLEAPK